ncbi:unnamed protein product [Notodromas monacha]|uniref:Uncharacterized protein n=1 Tax=Notodromas monacha TaxID=399045 RepID=A0A7R9GH12_9CRUS|nr:unnamed protein product [Notodromas monacha]CAG0922414.1 unnamed protein product [Notodromas monacha]
MPCLKQNLLIRLCKQAVQDSVDDRGHVVQVTRPLEQHSEKTLSVRPQEIIQHHFINNRVQLELFALDTRTELKQQMYTLIFLLITTLAATAAEESISCYPCETINREDTKTCPKSRDDCGKCFEMFHESNGDCLKEAVNRGKEIVVEFPRQLSFQAAIPTAIIVLTLGCFAIGAYFWPTSSSVCLVNKALLVDPPDMDTDKARFPEFSTAFRASSNLLDDFCVIVNTGLDDGQHQLLPTGWDAGTILAHFPGGIHDDTFFFGHRHENQMRSKIPTPAQPTTRIHQRSDSANEEIRREHADCGKHR